MSFKTYYEAREIIEAKYSLSYHLIESNVDLNKFIIALDILQEWGFNPFKSFGKSAATGAGAVLGSALGPAGTALGGLAGGAIGEIGSQVAGRVMKGSRVQSMQPVFQQAVQAVNSLSQMLDSPDVQAVPEAQKLKQNIGKIQQYLKNSETKIAPIDQKRNANLDQKLQSGGGIGQKLRGAQGEGTFAKLQRGIGEKIKNIPALNKDMGLRRALSQGMDALNAWAQKNPKKAAVLNIGATVAGGVAGATGAAALQSTFGSAGQPATNKTGNKDIETKSQTARNAGEFLNKNQTSDNLSMFFGKSSRLWDSKQPGFNDPDFHGLFGNLDPEITKTLISRGVTPDSLITSWARSGGLRTVGTPHDFAKAWASGQFD